MMIATTFTDLSINSSIAIKNIAARAMLALALLVFAMISGCATGPNANPADPLEPLNRTVYKVNDGIDRAVFKPVATAYVKVVPSLVRKGVTNFFDNLEDMWSFVNSSLQLRGTNATDNLFRVVLNTFFGLGGILNVADEAGIPRHPEDLGKTLGRWGVPSGPYIVLPLLGPTTLRDSFTIAAETKADLLTRIDTSKVRDTAKALRIVDLRARFLKLDGFLDDAALDKYSFTRDAFLQKRRASIYRSDAKDQEKNEDKDEDFSKDSKQDSKEPAK